MNGADGPGLLVRAERLGRWLENLLLAVMLLTLIGLAAGQVLFRYAGIQGLPWGDEALRLMVLWVAMTGAVAASRDDTHLRIDLLSRYLPEPARSLAALVVDLFTAGISGVLAWFSWRFVAESREFGDVLLGALPAWPFQAVLPVAFTLIAYRYGIWSWRRVRAMLPGRGPA